MFDQAPPPTPAAVEAAETPAASTSGTLIAGPVWVRRPTADDFNQVFPIGSYAEFPVMQAAATCTVTGKGLLTDCVVTSEAPAGRGMGAGLLRLSRFYRMKPTVDGHSVEGAHVPISFRLGSSARDHH